MSNTEEIIKLLEKLASEEKLKVTVVECVKGGAIIGGMAALGGLLLGPPGLAIGGCVGSCVSAVTTRNKFTSVVKILSEMEPERREALAENVRRIMRNIDARDVALLAGLVAGNTTVRRQVIAEITNYIREEMHIAVANH